MPAPTFCPAPVTTAVFPLRSNMVRKVAQRTDRRDLRRQANALRDRHGIRRPRARPSTHDDEPALAIHHRPAHRPHLAPCRHHRGNRRHRVGADAPQPVDQRLQQELRRARTRPPGSSVPPLSSSWRSSSPPRSSSSCGCGAAPRTTSCSVASARATRPAGASAAGSSRSATSWIPVRIMHDLWQGSDPAGGNHRDWRGLRRSPLIGWWWGLFLTSRIFTITPIGIVASDARRGSWPSSWCGRSPIGRSAARELAPEPTRRRLVPRPDVALRPPVLGRPRLDRPCLSPRRGVGRPPRSSARGSETKLTISPG